MALPVKNRLKKKKDFDLVFKKGKAVNGSFLFIKYVKSEFDYPRLGFVVAAKFAPKAVIRNKVRRLFSGIVWPELLPNMLAYDTVVVVTKKIPEDLSVVKDDFIKVLKMGHFI